MRSGVDVPVRVEVKEVHYQSAAIIQTEGARLLKAARCHNIGTDGPKYLGHQFGSCMISEEGRFQTPCPNWTCSAGTKTRTCRGIANVPSLQASADRLAGEPSLSPPHQAYVP